MILEKTLFIYWGQGFNYAPEVVKICYETWKKHNSKTWKIIELNDENINQYVQLESEIPNISKKNMMLCHKADIIRVLLLEKYGGVWVDATTYCIKPLDEWLHQNVRTGFFAFDKPGPDRMISNWFLYSEKNGIIISSWKNKIIEYWKKNTEIDHYFRHLYLFAELYNERKEFKLFWNATPKISAYIPHSLQAAGLFSPISDYLKEHIEKKQSPLYKLVHKFKPEQVTDGCVLDFILKKGRKEPRVPFEPPILG